MLGFVDDLLSLSEFNEKVLVENLKARYEENKIYVSINSQIQY